MSQPQPARPAPAPLTISGRIAALARRIMGLPPGDWIIHYRNRPDRRRPQWTVSPAPEPVTEPPHWEGE